MIQFSDLKNALIKCKKIFLYFGDNSSLHGLRFVTEKQRSELCRIFWLLALVICAFCFHSMLKGTIKSYKEDSLSFNPDINRLEFQTTFPAVSVCEVYGYSRTNKKINKEFPGLMDQYDYDYRRMITEQVFGVKQCELCKQECKPSINCSIDFKKITLQVRANCEELIHTCTWLNTPFDCCKHFLPIDTNYGTCFSLNTLQSQISGSVPLFYLNTSTGPGAISFAFYKTVKVHIHGNEDVPWSKPDFDMSFEAEDTISFHFRSVEMTNDPLVQNVDMEIRKCRFRNEIIPSVFGENYQMYSYSTCIVSCEREVIFKQCHCIHHLMDVPYYVNLTCNYTGLGCLAEFESDRRLNEFNEKYCGHCLPSCQETELNKVIELEIENDDDDRDNTVNIIMTTLPSIQYKRNVVRTKLDIVVSIGGLAGLFFGASLLSLVEAVYYLCIRTRDSQQEMSPTRSSSLETPRTTNSSHKTSSARNSPPELPMARHSSLMPTSMIQ